MTSLTNVDLRSDGRSVEAVLHGEIDLASAPRLRAALDSGIDWSDTDRVRFDLRRVSFMDSSGLAALIWMRQRHDEVTMELLVEDESMIARLLEITSMSALFTIERAAPSVSSD